MLTCYYCHRTNVPDGACFCPFCGKESVQPYSVWTMREAFSLYFREKKELDREFSEYRRRLDLLEARYVITKRRIRANCTHMSEAGEPLLDHSKDDTGMLTCELCDTEFDDDQKIPIVARWYKWLRAK